MLAYILFNQRAERSNVVADMIKEVLAKYPVDPSRVSLTGLSSGGEGCWLLASRHSDLFSAVAPHGATVTVGLILEGLKEIPIWAFHSVNDKAAPIGSAREGIARVKRAGGQAHLTEIREGDSKRAYYDGHDCWTSAFNDYGLLEWMLAQQRHSRSWLNGPGSVPLSARIGYYLKHWKWWELALQAAIPLGLIAGVWTIVRLRRSAAER